MHNHKSMTILIIIAAAAVLIAGSLYYRSTLMKASPSAISDTSGSKVILDYYIWDDEESYIKQVINAYCALNKNVKINLHVNPSVTYDEDITKLLSGNTKIDLLGIRGISQMVQGYKEGFLKDLTSYIKSNDMDVTAYGSMFNDIAIDGRYYGIPARSTCWFLLYNKDIFDQEGIDYPGQMTWEQYRRLAITLTTGEGDHKIYGGYWAPWCCNFAAIQQSSYLIDDDLTLTRESLELLNDFYSVDKSHISYSVVSDEDTNYRTLFEKGNIAMMPQGEWIINMLLADKQKGLTNINWDIAPMPVWEGQDPGVTWGQYQFVSIANDTAYPKEAFNFIQFLCGEQGARIYAQNGMIHAYSNDKIKQIYLNTVGKKSASYFYEAKKVQEQLAVTGYAEIMESFKAIAKNYLSGKITIDQAMAKLEKERAEILNP